MSFFIRRAQHQDTQSIIDVHVSSIREICSQDYTPEQIHAWTSWSGRNSKNALWHDTIDRDYVWVLEKEGLVVGFAHLAHMSETHAELMGLYFAPSGKGHGMGKEMMVILLHQALQLKVKKISLHSTLTAKSFYESFGFLEVDGDRSIEIGGEPIPCFPLELRLDR